MAMQTNLWSALSRSTLNVLAIQSPHVFTYAFLSSLGCKASCHRCFERFDGHLVAKWIRLSMFLLVSQFGLLMAVSFNTGLLDKPALLAVGFIGINPWLITITSIVLSVFIPFGLAGQLRRIPTVARIL